jgi:drug/metabolite transporter (DMT)-like permease
MAKVTLTSPTTPAKASLIAIWSAMIAVYIVWGSTYLAMRFAVQTMPPFLMASTRFLVAGGLLFIVRRMAGDPLPHRFEARSAAIVGLFLLLGGNGAVVWAEQTIPSGLTALMVSSSPLWMLLLEMVIPGSARPSPRALAGIFAGFAGVLILIWPDKSGGLFALDPWGAGALIFATLAWSFGSVVSRYLRLPESPMMGTAVEMLAGGALLFLLGAATGELGRVHLASISSTSLLGLGYLVFFGSLVGFTAYTWLLRVAPTSLVSTYAYVNPLIALSIGTLIGNEDFSARTLIAAAVILGSVALITGSRSAPKNTTD